MSHKFPEMRIGFGQENLPEFSYAASRSATELKWWNGGDQPEACQSRGADVENISAYIKEVSKTAFTAKIVCSKYGKGWGIYSVDYFPTFELAKAWVESIYVYIPVEF